MAKYLMVCDVASSDDIVLRSWGVIQCRNGANLELIPYQPTLADLSYSQVGELIGATILIFSVAWVFRFVIDSVMNKR